MGLFSGTQPSPQRGPETNEELQKTTISTKPISSLIPTKLLGKKVGSRVVSKPSAGSRHVSASRQSNWHDPPWQFYPCQAALVSWIPQDLLGLRSTTSPGARVARVAAVSASVAKSSGRTWQNWDGGYPATRKDACFHCFTLSLSDVFSNKNMSDMVELV